jgi:hypothetical protein
VWRLHSRESLRRLLPTMVENTFREQERRVFPLTARPSSITLVLGKTVPRELLQHSQEVFGAAVRPTIVQVTTEQQARNRGQLTPSRCRGCVVLDYREVANNPFFGHIQVEFWSGGLAAAGYDEYFIHLFGMWAHARTRLAWIS